MITQTTIDQKETEEKCLPLLLHKEDDQAYVLDTDKHKPFLRAMLGKLPAGFKSLDASKPWMVFWGINALNLLGEDISDLKPGIEATIFDCACPDGGFGGGFGQPAHLAGTYASVMALCHTSNEAWARIDRKGLYRWMLSLKQPDGSFKVCLNGEADPRATYCALSVAFTLGILDEKLRKGVGDYIKSCQTHEGGFGNGPLAEAHGGYAFCALASLYLLDADTPQQTLHKYMDVDLFVDWLSARQHPTVPGFSGRTNKLVDGCYSHWVGTCWSLIEPALKVNPKVDLWDREGLQDYIILCCQSESGGLRDKPGCEADAYHTNYCLCGLAACQYRYRPLSLAKWHVTKECEPTVKPLHPVLGVSLDTAYTSFGWTANVKAAEKGQPKTLQRRLLSVAFPIVVMFVAMYVRSRFRAYGHFNPVDWYLNRQPESKLEL